jgi:branched-chain amino acid transport system substrate-binding protein
MEDVMKVLKTVAALAATSAMLMATPALAEDIIIGMATAQSGWMEAYDKPAKEAALIRIDEINAAGGLLGKQIKVVEADTKTGQEVLDGGAEMVVVSCDYDFGSPAATVAEGAGKISFFLCAESIKAGIPGVGPHSFSASVLAAVQGATMGEWAMEKKGVKDFYVLLDTWIEYNKGICDGFDWITPKLEAKGAKIVGRDTFKNDDASIAAQITRIKSLPKEPDAIMLCSVMPGAASVVKQLRAAGIKSKILNGSSVDGSYWLSAVPDLSDFYVPVQGSVFGDDPDPKVEAFNKTYEAKYKARPATQYTYPGYVLIDIWAKAVERAKTTDTDAVTAELEKMVNEPTIFGPRSFSATLHHQNIGRYLISEVANGKPHIVDQWTISEPIPVDYLTSK